jgi:hypothetical protein
MGEVPGHIPQKRIPEEGKRIDGAVFPSPCWRPSSVLLRYRTLARRRASCNHRWGSAIDNDEVASGSSTGGNSKSRVLAPDGMFPEPSAVKVPTVPETHDTLLLEALKQ